MLALADKRDAEGPEAERAGDREGRAEERAEGLGSRRGLVRRCRRVRPGHVPFITRAGRSGPIPGAAFSRVRQR
jgi:hypothetical protein